MQKKVVCRESSNKSPFSRMKLIVQTSQSELPRDLRRSLPTSHNLQEGFDSFLVNHPVRPDCNRSQYRHCSRMTCGGSVNQRIRPQERWPQLRSMVFFGEMSSVALALCPLVFTSDTFKTCLISSCKTFPIPLTNSILEPKESRHFVLEVLLIRFNHVPRDNCFYLSDQDLDLAMAKGATAAPR